MDCFIIVSTVSNEKEGQRISRILVKERLAACVNIIPRVKSIYSWKGKICEEQETLIIVKTVRGIIQETINKIKGLHSYEVPEILAFKAAKGEKTYLKWLLETAQPRNKKIIDNKKVNR